MISRWCSGPCDGDLFLLVGFLGSFVELMPLTSGVFIVKSGSGDVDNYSCWFHLSGVWKQQAMVITSSGGFYLLVLPCEQTRRGLSSRP